jgi:hypothetical protein
MSKLSPEQRAAISRANGAKSRGPRSQDGKRRSARNAIKSGAYAAKFADLVPPHSAVLCNEDRQAYYRLLDQLLHNYQPVNQEAATLVKQIAHARWQVERLQTRLNMVWNAVVLDSASQPVEAPLELAEMHILVRSDFRLFEGRSSAVERINRQIDRLELRIARLRRGLREVNTHFPHVAPHTADTVERTQPCAEPAAENKGLRDSRRENVASNPNPAEPPLYLTERDEKVIQAYRREFPGRPIVFLPPDDVALGRVPELDPVPWSPPRAA